MSEGTPYSLSPVLERSIGSQHYALISQIGKDVRDLKLITMSADSVAYYAPRTPIISRDLGLTSLMLHAFFRENLSQMQNTQLDEVMERVRKDVPLAGTLENLFRSAEESVQGYVANPTEPFAYWLPSERLQDELAKTLVDLKCHDKVRQVKRALRDAGKEQAFVIDSFQDPKSDMQGVWMSTQGVRFDPAKLKAA